jgi:hypothetical protein
VPADLTRAEILTHALRIGDEYERQGLNITLRQLYYQFVSQGLTASGQLVYKRIGDVLTEARYAGEFPLDQMVDRGRHVDAGEFTRYDVDSGTARDEAGPLLGALPELLLGVDRWQGQPTFVSVWVEKEALAGVFEPVCAELGVSWFACRGYPSVSALWSWLQKATDVIDAGSHRQSLRWPGDVVTHERHVGEATEAVVLYFGDHDPDGWEIPRSAERNIRRLMELKNIDFPLTFVRVALNMEQIRRYRPPPFEAKVTSARYRGYIDEHRTNDAWELDALDPRVLRDLIRRHVAHYFDGDIRRRNEAELAGAREALRKHLAKPAFLKAALAAASKKGGE